MKLQLKQETLANLTNFTPGTNPPTNHSAVDGNPTCVTSFPPRQEPMP